MNIEVTLNERGNTIVGNYTDYLPLSNAMDKCAGKFMFPSGFVIVADKSGIARMADYVLTFANCLKTRRAWENCAVLADVESFKWEGNQ